MNLSDIYQTVLLATPDSVAYICGNKWAQVTELLQQRVAEFGDCQ